MLVPFLRYISSFLLLALVVAAVLLLTIDFGRFKGHAEMFVSDLLNRELSFSGPVHLTVGRSIEFSAANGSLASTDWSNAQSLVSFSRIKVSVNTWSLISGPILLESIVLDGLRVNLEQKESGENNWTLIEPSTQDPNQVTPPPIERTPDSRGPSILTIHINITDSLLSYQNPDIEQEIVLVIDKAQQVIDELYDLQFIVDGNINQIPISLNATASTENQNIDYSDIDFNLSAAVGDLQIEAIAVIDDLLKPSRPTVSAHINGPNMEHLAETLGMQPFATGLFKMDLELQPVGQKMQLDLAAILGEFEVAANGKFVDLQKLDNIELQLTAAGPDIGGFSQLLGLPGIIDGPFDIEAKIIPQQGASKSIFLEADAGDIGIKIDGSINGEQGHSGQKVNVRFQAASFNRIADALEINHIPDRAIDLQAIVERLDTGILIDNGSLTFGKDKLDFSGIIGNQPLKPGTNISFQSSMPDIQKTLTDFNIEVAQLPEGEFVSEGQILGGDQKVLIRDLKLSLGGVKANLEADLSQQPPLVESQIKFAFEGKDLSVLVPSNDKFRVPKKAFTLEGNVLLNEKNVTISELQLDIGNNQLSADVILGLKPTFKSVRTNKNVSGPNFNDQSVIKAVPFDVSTLGEFEVAENGKFVDLQILDDIELQLTAGGPDIGDFKQLLGLPGIIDGPFDIKAKIIPQQGGSKSIFLKAVAGDIGIKIDGSINGEQGLSGQKVNVRFQAASFNRMADALEINHIPDRAIDLQAIVERLDTGILIDNGSLTFGKDKLDFSGIIGNQPLKPGTNISFQSSMPDIQKTLTDFNIKVAQLPAGEFVSKGQILGGDQKVLIRDLQLSLGGVKANLEAYLSPESPLADSQLKFAFEGKDLSVLVPSNDKFRVPKKAFTLEGNVLLNEKNVTISELQLDIGNNQLSADVILGLKPTLKSLRANINVSGPNLNALSPNFNHKSMIKKVPFDVSTEIFWKDGLLEINKLLAKAADARIEINGSIQDPPNFNNANLKLVVNIADMHNLSVLLGRDMPHAPADLKIHLQGKGNTITAKEFNGHFGDSDLRGDLFYRAADIPELNLKLVSKKLNLSPYLQDEQASASPNNKAKGKDVADANNEEGKQSTATNNADDRLFKNTTIPVELLQGYTANLDINIQELTLKQHVAKGFVLSALIDKGALEVKEFEMETIAGGKINGRLGVITKQEKVEIWGTLNGEKLSYGLPFETEKDLAALPRYNIDMAFLSKGGTYRELAAVLNGYFKLTGSSGEIKSGSMQMFTNDFLFDLMNKINPFAKTDAVTKLKCTVLLAKVELGKLVGEPALVVQSERINIFADMRVDLSTEELSVNFNTIPQKALVFSVSNLINPYIQVAGKLNSPILSLNPEGVILEGGVALATGGLSILVLGLKERLFSEESPCAAAIAAVDDDFKALAEKYSNPPASNY